jgi:hypothetical protein
MDQEQWHSQDSETDGASVATGMVPDLGKKQLLLVSRLGGGNTKEQVYQTNVNCTASSRRNCNKSF